MVVGAALGLWLGPAAKPLALVGRVVIDLIKAFAVPLLFFAVIDAFLRTPLSGRGLGRWFLVLLVNAAAAVTVGFAISNLFTPGEALRAYATATPSPAANPAPGATGVSLEGVLGHLPTNIVKPFLDQALIPVVLIAVAFGAALREVRRRGEVDVTAAAAVIAAAAAAAQVILTALVHLVPIAVFAVTARTVGEHGFAPFAGLSGYLISVAAGLLLHVLVVYNAWVYFAGRMPLRAFWSEAKEPVVYALGVSSSLATLPVTMAALERLKVSPAAARLTAMVGTNLNNDGILLYEAAAVLYVAQAHGIALSAPEQLAAAGACVVATVGIAGVPEAGMVSLAVVLATMGLPDTLLPMLLTVDWLLGRCRAAVNVTGDLAVALVADRWAGVGYDPADAAGDGGGARNTTNRMPK